MSKLTRVLRMALDVFDDLYEGASQPGRDRVAEYSNRAKKVFRSQRSHTLRNISSIAAVTGLGLGVGLLLGPSSGAGRRREIFKRKVFRSQRKHPFRNLGSFAAGTGLGLGVGLLLAPASGAEARREIFTRVEGIRSAVRERFSLGVKMPPARVRAATGSVEQAAE
jgi:hypothetical protein